MTAPGEADRSPQAMPAAVVPVGAAPFAVDAAKATAGESGRSIHALSDEQLGQMVLHLTDSMLAEQTDGLRNLGRQRGRLAQQVALAERGAHALPRLDVPGAFRFDTGLLPQPELEHVRARLVAARDERSLGVADLLEGRNHVL